MSKHQNISPGKEHFPKSFFVIEELKI